MSSERITHDPVDGLRAGRYGFGLDLKAVCYRLGQTLIDTGPSNQWHAVRRFVLDQNDSHGIERVVLTHHHEDHAGNAGRIQDLLEVPVYAPEASLERLREGPSLEPYRWILWGRPSPVEAEPVPETLPLGNGSELHTIPTPGHSDDMVCYLVPSHGFLFAADLYVVQRPEYLHPDEDVLRLVQSIHDVLDHDFETVFCGHRGVVDGGRRALAEKAKYLEALCGVVQRRYNYDKLSLQEITDEILGREGLPYWLTGGTLSKHNLIASCLEQAPHEASQIVG